MTGKVLLAALAISLTIGGAFLFWRIQEANANHDAKAKAERIESGILKGLTEEEINLVLTSQSLVEPSKTLAIIENGDTRGVFLKSLREYFALAARARREGLADDPNFKLNYEFKKNLLLANVYQNKLDNDQKKYYQIPAEQMKAVWANAENEKRFAEDMRALQTIQKNVAAQTGNPAAAAEGDGLLNSPKTREMWAKTKILSDMAKADADFMRENQKVLDLQFKIYESGILSSDYLHKHFQTNIKVSDREINAFLDAHPEYDVNKKREKAEMLLQRAKNGEDLAALANEFSEDRLTRRNGGLFEEDKTGKLWAEVRKAALELNEGQLADRLVESIIGWHVVRLVKKQTKQENGIETVNLSVRHILLQKRFEDPANKNPDIPPPFVEARDIAKARIQLEKRDRFVQEIVSVENISLPADFNFQMTEDLKMLKENRSGIAEKLERDKEKIKRKSGEKIKRIRQPAKPKSQRRNRLANSFSRI